MSILQLNIVYSNAILIWRTSLGAQAFCLWPQKVPPFLIPRDHIVVRSNTGTFS